MKKLIILLVLFSPIWASAGRYPAPSPLTAGGAYLDGTTINANGLTVTNVTVSGVIVDGYVATNHTGDVVINGTLSLGTNNTASGNFSAAIGQANTASGNYGVALGSASTASGTSSVGIGGGSATNINAIAIGYNAYSGHDSTIVMNSSDEGSVASDDDYQIKLQADNGIYLLGSEVTINTDPTSGTSVGNRDYNDNRYGGAAAVSNKVDITDGIATNLALHNAYATSVGTGSSNIVTQAEITAVSNTLDSAYTAADTVVSNALDSAYTAADTIVSNALYLAYTAADTVVSNALESAYTSSDSAVSNAVTSAYIAADTTVSNALVSLNSSISNALALADAGKVDTNHTGNVIITGAVTVVSGELTVSTDPTTGDGLGNRDYNDNRYSLAGEGGTDRILITDGVGTNTALYNAYASSVGAGSTSIVTRAEITSVSNALTTAYGNADTAVSNGLTTAFGNADTTVSNGLTTAYTTADTAVSNGLTTAYGNADTAVSNGLTTAFGNADTVVSNGLVTAYGAADTVVSNALVTAYGNADTAVSNGLTTAFGAADTVVSNGLTTAFGAADTVVSNGLTTAFGAADTIVSNGLVAAYAAADTVVSNALVAIDAGKVDTNHTGNVDITGILDVSDDVTTQERIIWYEDSAKTNFVTQILTNNVGGYTDGVLMTIKVYNGVTNTYYSFTD